jgi:ribosome-associated heat shock protein Hsp15
MRLDVWLWAVRAFKTRSLSVDSIKSGNVQIDAQLCKPARGVRIGECITIRIVSDLAVWTRTLRVVGLPQSRVGAKLVAQFAEDLTPPEELQKARTVPEDLVGYRPRGSGRPTKRERREIENIHSIDAD